MKLNIKNLTIKKFIGVSVTLISLGGFAFSFNFSKDFRSFVSQPFIRDTIRTTKVVSDPEIRMVLEGIMESLDSLMAESGDVIFYVQGDTIIVRDTIKTDSGLRKLLVPWGK